MVSRITLGSVAALLAPMLSAPAVARAESRLGVGYSMSRPIAGDAGGADHALALRAEYVVDSELDLGVTVQLGHSFGNDVETLSRVAVLPTIGLSGDLESLVIRADVAIGWQLAHGDTRIAGIQVTGTEPRGARIEVGMALEAPLSDTMKLRGRGAIALSGLYPEAVSSSSRLSPTAEIALVVAF